MPRSPRASVNLPIQNVFYRGKRTSMRLVKEEWGFLLCAANDKHMTVSNFIEFAGKEYNCNLTNAVKRAMLRHFFEKANSSKN